MLLQPPELDMAVGSTEGKQTQECDCTAQGQLTSQVQKGARLVVP